jgi:tetratricopeptide (TPR) repeat protein
MTDRLLVDLGSDGIATVGLWPEGGLPEIVSRNRLEWPLGEEVLEDLRWYLEDYLRAPFGVWEERGPKVQARLGEWGEAVFASVFGSGPARDAYQRARDLHLELVFRSAEPAMLGLPWELMRDPAGPMALGLAAVSRSLPVAELVRTTAVPAGHLRVLMVISRPAGTSDVRYQMVARPLLERLNAAGGQVELVVLRPPTLEVLSGTLAEAASAGRPFHVVHFDGHGALPGRRAVVPGRQPAMMAGPAAEGVLAFEKPGGGTDEVAASKLAAVLKYAGVPVVVLNACQSGAVGKDVEAAVATRLMRDGCAAVVAMAYSVYAVAAAEFMAIFYERLFAGETVSAAVTAGRRRLFERDGRPSPKGEMPLSDWLVPVHYMRREVSFPQTNTSRSPAEPSLEALLDELRTPRAGRGVTTEALDPNGPFVGRDDIFYQLEVAARLRKVVILHGPGGTGKTELAKAFGRWWRDTGGAERPEWVIWQSFEPGVASFGLDGLITEIGLQVFGPEFSQLAKDERNQAVELLLQRHRLLLIWDNFETVRSMPDPLGTTAPLDHAQCIKVKDFLARLTVNGKSAVVITSRTAEEWLGPVQRIKVGGLTREEAAQYAGELLAAYPAAVARRERRAFGELLEWLNGHPLGMRLILPRLDITDPEVLLDELQGITAIPADDEAGNRATSLAASITYSFTHLNKRTQELLPAVSLFRDVANTYLLALFSEQTDVAARFAGADTDDWAQALDDATRVGLLTALGTGMYRIHPALPAYLAARWHADDSADFNSMRDDATRTLCTACGFLCAWLQQQIESGHAWGAYMILGMQRRTFGALLGYALDHRMWEQAQAIMEPLHHYWEAEGLTEEAGAWTDQVQLATEDAASGLPLSDVSASSLWLSAVSAHANLLNQTMRLDDAERIYHRILKFLRTRPASQRRQSQIGIIKHNLGNIALDRGRLAEAEDWYRESLTTREALGDRPGMASSYHQQGILAISRGQLKEAENWFRKSLAIFKSLGDQPHAAGSYHELGLVAQRRGQLEGAETWYRKSLDILERLGDRPHMAGVYHQLGMVARERGQLDEAEEWYLKSLSIFESLGYSRRMAGDYHELGMVAQEQGRLDEAEQWYQKSLSLKEDFDDPLGNAASYNQLGVLAQKRGQLDEAEEWYRKSLEILESLGDPLYIATGYHSLGVLAQERGELDEAEEWYRKSLAIVEGMGDSPVMAPSYYQLGLLAELRGQPSTALDWLVRSVTVFEYFPHPMAGPGPDQLARLAVQLGVDALETSWLKITGNSLPQTVRDHVMPDGPEAGQS